MENIPATSDNTAGTIVLRNNTGGCAFDGNVSIGVDPVSQSYAGFGHLEVGGSTQGGVFQMSTAAADGNNVEIGQVMWVDRNSTATGAAGKTVASIKGELSGTTANNRGAAISFWTKPDNGTTTAERLRIDRNGFVGIGTVTASERLDVVGNIECSNSNAAAVKIIATGASGRDYRLLSTDNANTSGGGKLIVYDGTASTPRMVVDSTGDVGIGTVSPSNSAGYTTLQIENAVNGGLLNLTNGAQALAAFVNTGGGYFGTTSNDSLVFQTNNAEQVRIDPAGSVGVGTAAPTKKVDVYTAGTATTDMVIRNGTVGLLSLVDATTASLGTSTNHPLFFRTNNAERLRIDASGNVGIGTNSPARKLDVNGSAAVTGDLSVSGNVGIGTSSPSQKLDVNGNVAITGSLTSTDGTSTLSLFNSAGVGTLGTTTNHPFSLQTNSVNRVRVDTDGNVGIGTDTPAEKLVLSAASGKVYGLCTNGTASNVFGVTSTNAGIFGTTTAHDVEIHANNAERIRIDTSGNVGIGTTPSTKLHVSGDARIDGDIIAGNSGTSARSLTLGDGRTGNGNAFIDLVGDTTYTDYGLRLIRNNTGADANSELIHRGTGSLQIKAANAGTVSLFSSNTERLRVSSNGSVLLFHTNSALPGFGNQNQGITFEALNSIFVSRASNPVLYTNRNNDGDLVVFLRAGAVRGTISVNTAGTNYGSSSDYRLKDNPTPLSDGISVIDALKPVQFVWKTEGSVGKGFIAHELQAVIPEAVTGEKDAVDGDGKPLYQNVDASKIVPYLVSAVKELKLRIEALEL